MTEKGMEAFGEGVLSAGSSIRVDEEGEWYHGDARIIRDDIIELFLDHLVRESDGTYVVEWRGSRCPIDTADTPFVVTRVDREDNPDTGSAALKLSLKHLTTPRVLDPTTLTVGTANILYCRVENDRFPARFSRPAYYQLAEWIVEDEDTGTFSLDLGSERVPIRGTV